MFYTLYSLIILPTSGSHRGSISWSRLAACRLELICPWEKGQFCSREPGGVTGVMQSVGKGKEALVLIPTASVFQYLLVMTPHGKVNWKCSVSQLCFHTSFLPPEASTGGNTSLSLQGQKLLTVREGTKVGVTRSHDIYCTEIKGMTNTCNTALLWRYSMQPEEGHTN